MAEKPITVSKVNDAVMFAAPGEKDEDVYVMTVVDPSKQIFTGLRVSKKVPFNFLPTDKVTIIDDPKAGPELLKL